MKASVILLLFFGTIYCQETNFYRSILLVPPKTKINQAINKALFRGYSETDLLSAFKKKYFDLSPIPLEKEKKYEDGFYKVVVSTDQLKEMITHEATGLVISLKYKIENNQKYLIQQKIFFEKSHIDTVDYRYKAKKLISAKSEIYGEKHYTEPKNSIHQWWRSLF